MKDKHSWESESLEWIHKVRGKVANELKQKRLTLSQWLRSREKPDIKEQCRRLGLTNITIVYKTSGVTKKKD